MTQVHDMSNEELARTYNVALESEDEDTLVEAENEIADRLEIDPNEKEVLEMADRKAIAEFLGEVQARVFNQQLLEVYDDTQACLNNCPKGLPAEVRSALERAQKALWDARMNMPLEVDD